MKWLSQRGDFFKTLNALCRKDLFRRFNFRHGMKTGSQNLEGTPSLQRKLFRRLVWGIPAVLLLLQILALLSMRWIDPRSSAFITRDQRMLRRTGTGIDVQHFWVDLHEISREMQLAVIAAEDQKFPHHFGFDVSAIEEALEQNTNNQSIRGASTITQQVVKNLFLWPSRNLLRKGLEAYLTLWIELLWPKERILEVYLNVAQFDDHLFGAGAASRYFFAKSATGLTFYEAALLTAVLPNPIIYSVEKPSSYLYRRVQWIQGQMRQLGDEYLDLM